MISIITAVYNQLDMNKLFWEYLRKYTANPFELIIIDNGSNDGSREFFESQACAGHDVTVIANDGNYSYPHCQNRGIAAAKHDVLVFFNNDLLVSPNWDTRMLEVLGKDGREVLSFSSNDRLHDIRETSMIRRRWKLVKKPLIFLFGTRLFSLKLMLRLMYRDWEKHCDEIFKRHGFSFTVGFSGAAIAATRKAVEKLSMWDRTQQAADWNLFFASCDRAEKHGDISPMSTVDGIFMHHYSRLTFACEKWPPFKDADNLRECGCDWTPERTKHWTRLIKTFGKPDGF